MPQSLSAVYIHLVFSTKDRRPLLWDKTTRAALHSYLGGISKQLDFTSIRIINLPRLTISWQPMFDLMS